MLLLLQFFQLKIFLFQVGLSTSQLTRPISVYSFALKPEDHQPSGTCNFSRIDTAQLIFGASKAATVYAVNYNVLRNYYEWYGWSCLF